MTSDRECVILSLYMYVVHSPFSYYVRVLLFAGAVQCLHHSLHYLMTDTLSCNLFRAGAPRETLVLRNPQNI